MMYFIGISAILQSTKMTDIVEIIIPQAKEWFEERGRSFTYAHAHNIFCWNIDDIARVYLEHRGTIVETMCKVFFNGPHHYSLRHTDYEIADPAFPINFFEKIEKAIQEDLQKGTAGSACYYTCYPHPSSQTLGT